MPFTLPNNWDAVDVIKTLIKLINDLEDRIQKLEGQPEPKEPRIKKPTT